MLAFVTENCLFEPGSVCSSNELFNEYVAYCDAANVGKTSLNKFVGAVSGMQGVTHGNDSRTRRGEFRGLRFVSQ